MIGASAVRTDGPVTVRSGRAGARCRSARTGLATVLLLGDVLQPVNGLAVERLLDGDVLHRRVGRRAVPVPLAGREPHHVAGADLLDRAALALHETAAEEHDQRLPERVRVPRRAGAQLEGD